ncbi:MAG: xanthine dehydrogenase family protein molybdopterin-binding subunit, partial [Rhodospirillaceae bacterium]|nr:xanthine dehydrogenase family protein molybdopterin-binding subunit [Rhodospirillaceae bacterium]
MKFGIGQPVPRKEDPRFLTGRGQYVGDHRFPNESHAIVLRSPHANARIVSMETDAAKELPGVLAVLTGQDYVDAGLGTVECVT